MMNCGRPVGISPSTGAPEIAKLVRVPMISAASGPGTLLARFFGHRKTTPSVTTPTTSAAKFGFAMAPGIAVRAGIVPPPSGSWPNRRAICNAMMMQPMPLMKPETTGYGTSRMY